MMSGAPWLLISHGGLDEEYTKQSLYDVTENRCYHADQPNHPGPFLNEKRVIGSTSDGWLVLSHFWDDVFWLWNPKSRSRIQLPPLEDTKFFREFVLTKPPSEPDCHIIFTAIRYNRIAYCRIGDGVFKFLNEWIYAVRSLKGRIYGVKVISQNIHLVSIEFEGAELRVMPIFKVKGSLKHDKIQDVHLVELEEEEELLLVYKIQRGCDPERCFSFRVYRVNPAAERRRECVELDSIGDRTLFIADSGDSFCCSAAANKTEPNCIYYAMAERRSLYICSIGNGSTNRSTTLLPSTAIHPFDKPYHSWIKQQPSKNLLTTYFHRTSY